MCGKESEKKMPEKIRKTIVAGQIALLGLAFFLFLIVIMFFTVEYFYYPNFWYLCYYYLSMPPLQIVVLASLLVILAVLLFPVARYKEKEDEIEKGEAEEDTPKKKLVCPNCKQSVPEGSKFCNHCGQNIGGFKIKHIKEKLMDKKSSKPEKKKR